MPAEPAVIDMGAFDIALSVSFFISCSILAVVQLSNLFNSRYIWFAALTAVSVALWQAVGRIDLSGLCAWTESALICNYGGRTMAAFFAIWIYVSLCMLALFGLVRVLRRFARN